METIKKGSTGDSVKELQKQLNVKGYPIPIDGVFGERTHIAVCQLQKQSGIFVDGIVGTATWNELLSGIDIAGEDKSSMDFEAASKTLRVEIAAIKAVHEVESGGRNGFLKDGRPIILFEGHIFWNQLRKRGINPEIYQNNNSDILFPKWNRNSYKGGAAEYERLKKAMIIHKEAALCSASWGMFQIMGFNYQLCGYKSVAEYVEAIRENQNNHLMSFVNFLKNTNLSVYLQRLDWEAFASKYNGPGYKQNQYDNKLLIAYNKYKNQ